MLKNKYIRLAAILLILCLATTCGVSGTFAKYTTGGTSADSARVAKWGIVITVVGDNAFRNAYGETVVSSNPSKNVVAPGTNGTLATVNITGTPEVAVEYTVTANLELSGWQITEDLGTVDYCPLVFTVDSTEVYMTSDKTMAQLETELENAVIAALMGDSTGAENTETSSTKTSYLEAGTSMSKSVTIKWKWDFEASSAPIDTGALNSDARDTAIGTLEAMPTVAFTLNVSATQID